MQYYSTSSDTISYPQVKGFGENIFITDPNHIYHFLEKYTMLDFSLSVPERGPNLDYLKINPQIKKAPADILSEQIGISKGFLISEKLKLILENFNLAPHEFYPCRICLKGEFWDYFYLFFYGHLGDKIDFGCSPIIVTNLLGNKIIEKVTFPAFQEYQLFYLENRHQFLFKFEKIVINSSAIFDMFGVFITQDFSIFSSENLKKAIKDLNITNVCFKELKENYIVFDSK